MLIVLSDFCLVQCRVIMETCDGLVMNSKDPLVVQPASLELAIIRKKQGEELVKNAALYFKNCRQKFLYQR